MESQSKVPGPGASDPSDGGMTDTLRLDFVLREGAFIVWSLRDGSIPQCQLWAQNEDEEILYLSGEHRFFNTERAAIDAALSSGDRDG